MPKESRYLLCLLFLLACCSLVFADTLYLKNGRKIEGLVKKGPGEMVELEVCSGSVKFKASEIERIEKSDEQGAGQIRVGWEREKKKTMEKIAVQQKLEESQPKKAGFSKEPYGISLAVKLNGNVHATLVMDTGSTLVVLKKGLAKELGINLENAKPDVKMILADGRKVNAKFTLLNSVEVEGAVAQEVEAAIMLDDDPENNFRDGLLGMSFLKRFNFKVDYKQKRLILEKL